jgi:hypothetical protein
VTEFSDPDVGAMDADEIEALALESDWAFLERYQALILAAWQDEAVRARLLAEPAAAAIDAGLPVEAGVAVRVDMARPGEPLLADQLVTGWTEHPGVHLLRLPHLLGTGPSERAGLALSTSALTVIIIRFGA